MRKLLTILILFFFVNISFAQKKHIVSCHNYLKKNSLKKAQKYIELAVNSGKTKESLMGKAWFYRGKTYHAIFQSKKEKDKKLSVNPLQEAIKSYQNSLKADTDGDFKDKNIHGLRVAGSQLFNAAVKYFQDKEFSKALENFENIIVINETKEIAKLDTQVFYNAALSAEKSNSLEKAKKYFDKCIEYKYGGAKIYIFLSKIYKDEKNQEAFIKTIKKGVENCPDNNSDLIIQLVNHYLETKQSKEALEYLKIAVEKDNKNASLYFAQGTLYDELKEVDKAVTSYGKATSLKEDYFDAWYNLGALYNNQAADCIRKANETDDDAKYQELKNKADENFTLALEPLEKAHKLDETDKSTMLSLKQIYYKLQMEEKYDKIDKKLKGN